MIHPRWRPKEFLLLTAALAPTLGGFALLGFISHGNVSLDHLRLGLALVGLSFLAHIFTSLRGFSGDQLLLPLTAALSGLGLIFVQRLAGVDLAQKQAWWIGLGFVAMVLILSLPNLYFLLSRYRYLWAFLGLSLVVITFVLGKGTTPSGPRLWLDLGPIHFQPSEALKLLLVIFFASYLNDYRELVAYGRYRLGPLALPPIPYLVPLGLVWGVSLLTMILQRDLGVAFLLFGIFVALLYIASGRTGYVLAGILAFGLAAWSAYQLIPLIQQRFEVWLNPWTQASGTGYQIIQGLIALGRGGVLGMGPGWGYPTYIPAVHTDFVFAAIGEELGLPGAMAVLIMYAMLVYRGYRVALDATRVFPQLLAAGLTTTLALQTLAILGGTLKLIPLTGITLPFVSYGGSSMLANYILVGLLLRISGDEVQRGVKDD